MSDSTVRNVPGEHRYEIWVDGTRAGVADYVDTDDGQRIFQHTEVDKAFGGRGLGGALVAEALSDTKAAGKKIQATCSFVVDYLEKHPEYAS